MTSKDETQRVLSITADVAMYLFQTGRFLKATEVCQESLILLNEVVQRENYFLPSFWPTMYFTLLYIMFKACYLMNVNTRGIECGKELLLVLRERDDLRDIKGGIAVTMAEMYRRKMNYTEARKLYGEALGIMIDVNNRGGQATCCEGLGAVFYHLAEHSKAKEHCEKAASIRKEICDKQEEVSLYGDLVLRLIEFSGEYVKAKEYCERALKISKEIGDKRREASFQGILGVVFKCTSEYIKAGKCLQESLLIRKKLGDRRGEGVDYGNLGAVYQCLGKYAKAEECHQKALEINTEIGNRSGEAVNCLNLGALYRSLGDYVKAKVYLEKSLAIAKEIGDRKTEASNYSELGTVFQFLSEYAKAEEHLQKALQMTREIGDKHEEALCNGNLGILYVILGKYVEAEECHQKALAIRRDIGDRQGEASEYGSLGALFVSLGEYSKGEEYIKKALEIRRAIGDRQGEAADYGNLGASYLCQGRYVQGKAWLQKSIKIRKEIGDKQGEAVDLGNLGAVDYELGEHVTSAECYMEGLSLVKEIGDKRGEASFYLRLGNLLHYTGKSVRAEKFHRDALAISKEIGDVEIEFVSNLNLAKNMMRTGNMKEAFSYLFSSIAKCEDMRGFVKRNDQFSISFLEQHVDPYRMLSALFWSTGKPHDALYAVELGRGRALADLISAQYSVEEQISLDPKSWVGIEKIMSDEQKCACLYISYFEGKMYFWILKGSKPILFGRTDVNECSAMKGRVRNLDKFFGQEPFRSLPEYCEDRSLVEFNKNHPEREHREDNSASCRIVEEEDEEDQEPQPSLALYYQLIIAPVADILDEPEIIIVPDRSLYKVPFAALKDEEGTYLSEVLRIRVVPSLAILKLIQEQPTGSQSECALIVGDPDVSEVLFLNQLPCARKEAEMIGRLLGAKTLIGCQATKVAVLEMIHSASLIHFAAHGDAERGEIALAPVRPVKRKLPEEDFMLTMADIAQVQLQAKMVVLSCCHSGRGRIGAEGVVGIARAFLGSGARSVLVSLWAIEDDATEKFMIQFYEHLVGGESASESLHETMNWMRDNGFSSVRLWAPFMLIGDNVTFDFRK